MFLTQNEPDTDHVTHKIGPLYFTFTKRKTNGCFDAYEVKVNKDIFKYQEKVKLISQFQRFLKFFNGLLEFSSFP